MAVTGTKTVRDITTHALRKAGITAWDETPAASESAMALTELELMLKSWQNEGYSVWTKASQSLTLTTAASYTLSPARPLRILSARLKRDGIETPMEEMTRDEYDNLPDKDVTGTPTQFHYDRQREAALFYIWPLLGTAAGETVEITYTRELEDIASLNDTIDVPGEMWLAVVANLGVWLRDAADLPPKMALAAQADNAKQSAFGFDREGSVWFCADEWVD